MTTDMNEGHSKKADNKYFARYTQSFIQLYARDASSFRDGLTTTQCDPGSSAYKPFDSSVFDCMPHTIPQSKLTLCHVPFVMMLGFTWASAQEPVGALNK